MSRKVTADVAGKDEAAVNSLRKRITTWLHERGMEPDISRLGDRLLVDFGESLSEAEYRRLAAALTRHLELRGGL